MVTRVIQPSSGRSMSKGDGSPSTQMNSWLKSITDKALIIGTGSPELIVEANQGALYMDETGASGAIMYIKRDADIGGDKTLGWVLI